jgi:DNA mismatch repair protein MutS2
LSSAENGIPFSLINRAKKKRSWKIALTKPLPPWNDQDGKTSQMLKEEKQKRKEGRKMETINIKIKQKLESYQELYD